jgi:Ca-activated chloride channel homolog
MTLLISSIGVFALTLIAELLHVRRVLKLSGLIFPSFAFGRGIQLAALLSLLGLIRSLAMGALAWGLLMLWLLPPLTTAADDLPDGKIDPATLRHIIIALDVSPSMLIKDAGEHGDKTRADQAEAVIQDALSQLDLRYARVSIIVFFTDAKPVAIDTVDPNIVKNFLSGLPLNLAFEDGQTDLFAVITKAFEVATPLEKDSTSILIASDGDSIPLTGMPDMPPSVSRVIFAGVGDIGRGQFIDGHFSRQESGILSQIATRLHGKYFNISTVSLPPDLLKSFSGTLTVSRQSLATGLRRWSLIAISLASTLLLMLPLLQLAFDRSTGYLSSPKRVQGFHA